MLYDAIVIGGSFAGISAATYIARGGRSVCVIDSGSPRNRFATASHGVFGYDNAQPSELIRTAQQQLMKYPTVQLVHGNAKSAQRLDGKFAVATSAGEQLLAAKLVLAFGISDELPDLHGIKECWGKSVLHCPYCHGFEFYGKNLGVLSTMPLSTHQAALVSDWGPTTLYLNGNGAVDDAARELLDRKGVKIDTTGVRELHQQNGMLRSLSLEDGREVEMDALFIATRTRLNSNIAEQLGCEIVDGPLGPVIQTDSNKQTSVTGVYAAGDVARFMHNATWASADGVTAGSFLHQSLVFK